MTRRILYLMHEAVHIINACTVSNTEPQAALVEFFERAEVTEPEMLFVGPRLAAYSSGIDFGWDAGAANRDRCHWQHIEHFTREANEDRRN